MDETFSSEKQKAGDTNNVVESVMKLIVHVRTVDAFVGEEGRREGGNEEGTGDYHRLGNFRIAFFSRKKCSRI